MGNSCPETPDKYHVGPIYQGQGVVGSMFQYLYHSPCENDFFTFNIRFIWEVSAL